MARKEGGEMGNEPESQPAVRTVTDSRRTYFLTIPVRPASDGLDERHLDKVSINLAVYGAGVLLLGLVAILFPLLFALTMARLIGWLLALGGAMSLLQFLLMCGAPAMSSFLLLGILHLLAGLWILLGPILGGGMLFFVIGFWFLMHGLLKLLMSFQLRVLATWPALMSSGLLSVVLAFASIALASRYGLVMLCIILGSDMVVSGTAMLLLACIAFFGRGSALSAALPSTVSSVREPLITGMSQAAASA